MAKKNLLAPKVLITGYEAAPFFKRGGLGDVMESLPKALSGIGVDIKLVIPYYEEIRKNFPEEKIGEFSMHYDSRKTVIGIYKSKIPNSSIVVYFLNNKENLTCINTRGRNKKINQFAFFDLAVVNFIKLLSEKKEWIPSIIHCNDWQTALIPLIIEKKKLNIPTLLTIHNLSYQGRGSLDVLNIINLQDKDAKEIKHGLKATEINILGEGILHATSVSTVSPTYAIEIMKPDKSLIGGYILRRKKEGLSDGEIKGILNGIDYDIWSPKKDNIIAKQYDISNWHEGKNKNKKALLEELGLPERVTFCFIGRMARQKGLDMLVKVVKKIVNLDANLIILGSGQPSVEKSIRKLHRKYPQNIRAEVFYSEELAHKIYAASDFIIIPSRFEPCGLIQMIAMAYGTIPIASKTGGLKDTIKNNSTGFLFETGHVVGLRRKVQKAVAFFKSDKKNYEQIVKRAMSTNFSWEKSARVYKKIYQSLL